MKVVLDENIIRQTIRDTLVRKIEEAAGFSGNAMITGDVVSLRNQSKKYGQGTDEIKKGVKWGPPPGGEKRKIAWEYLRHFLPTGTVLTSCYREQADQRFLG